VTRRALCRTLQLAASDRRDRSPMPYPVDLLLRRVPPAAAVGPAFIVDVDRTYLETHFSSLAGLARIPAESAADKRDVPGMARLLREVRRGGERARAAGSGDAVPLFFASASPAQLRGVIERKLDLDGIGFDGSAFKAWGRVLAGGFRHKFKDQLAYKLTALLRLAHSLPAGLELQLIGDDLEADPLTFALCAGVLARELDADALDAVLAARGTTASDRAGLRQLAAQPGPRPKVERAYIRLERSEPAALAEFAPVVVGVRSAWQLALALWVRGHVDVDGAVRVAHELRARRGVADTTLRAELDDLVTRGLLPASDRARVAF
jgi:hypothetical protein